MLPKGLVLKEDGRTASINLYKYGTRLFVKETEKWFSFYEELSQPEQHQLFNYFISNIPGKSPIGLAQTVEEKDLNFIRLENFPKISAEELVRLVKFYKHFGTKTPRLEAGVLLFHSKSQNLVKFVIPSQKILGSSWDWDISENKPLLFLDPAFNKTEGKFTIDELNTLGWERIGTSHSHHIMNCTWSRGPTGDYANQAGSKEKPLPPMLHILFYGMSIVPTEDCPNFSLLTSVNTFGDLVDVPLDQVFDFSFEPDYSAVEWVGPEKAEELCVYTAPVVQRYAPVKLYPHYSHPATPVKKGPTNTKVVDAEATLNYLATLPIQDENEYNYQASLAVELLQDVPGEIILEVVSKLVDILERQDAEYTTHADIFSAIVSCSYILQEGLYDFFDGDFLNEQG